MTTSAIGAEPACPEGRVAAPGSQPVPASLEVRACSFAEIPRRTWDRLAAGNPWATPFSSWAFHRAWWDAFGARAEDCTLVVTRATNVDLERDPDPGPGTAPGARPEPVAILPMMRRHEIEPGDAGTHTTLRHEAGMTLEPVPPAAMGLFMGASYHADYATILAAPGDLEAAADVLVASLAGGLRGDRSAWDVVDLRRLRCGDPAADMLAEAFRRREPTEHWAVSLEREDVCPVATIPAGADLDGFFSILGKKQRHEIRRKVRRAEAAGQVCLIDSTDPLVDLDAFVDLHQRRWGGDGLFPATPGGDDSRRFIRRLFETFGPDGAFRLAFLTIGGRRVAAGLTFEDGDTIAYYNAGVDPDARELSPGVLMVAGYLERAIAGGRHRLDFLRGDEDYKYEWGAVDEPIQRLLVRRAAGAA